jgi:hypothetical protein
MIGHEKFEYPRRSHNVRNRINPIFFLAAILGLAPSPTGAQQSNEQAVIQQIRQLTDSMTRAQTQIEESQRQLNAMKQQLAALERRIDAGGPDSAGAASGGTATSVLPPPAPSTTAAATIEDLQGREAMQSDQIATLDQSKVESQSKYSVKLSGLLLFNGFVNTSAVDIAATPTMAQSGPGSAGATIRQTILGIEASGPHLFDATSHADLSVDFDGTPQNSASASSTTTYTTLTNQNSTLLRLRTIHASLQWPKTEVFFSLDRPIFSPDTPTSLTALASPALAWSGNLWSWNPQAGVTQDVSIGTNKNIQFQAAIIDVGDAPETTWSANPHTTTTTPPTTAEQSRRPGGEAHFSFLGTKSEERAHFGIGAYLAPHVSLTGVKFNSWASTADYRLPLPLHFQLTGAAYRGEALGGLGEGEYKDYVIRRDTDGRGTDGTGYYFRSLDDIGGWGELKQSVSGRLQFNAAFGIDEVFARQLRRYAGPASSTYLNLARNRTYTENVIYSPSAYLLFSIEHRYLQSAPVVGSTWGANVIGLGAAYRF